MSYDPEIHRRQSIRLKEYDYSREGLYFITVCTYNREFLFGDIIVGARCTCPKSCTCQNSEAKMFLNDFGKIVENELKRTNKIRKNVYISEYIIMPNHIHFIIEITEFNQGHVQRAPTLEKFGKSTSNTIPTIVRLIKSSVTKQINVKRNTEGAPIWQSNYYEHIIRNEETYQKICEYIRNNHLTWKNDKYFS